MGTKEKMRVFLDRQKPLRFVYLFEKPIFHQKFHATRQILCLMILSIFM